MRTARLLAISPLVAALLCAVVAAPSLLAQGDDVPRTPSGKADLTGTYNIATLTPFERPQKFGESLYLTPGTGRGDRTGGTGPTGPRCCK